MYVGKIRWAGVYVLLALLIALAGEVFLFHIPNLTGAMQFLLGLACGVHAYRLAATYPEDKPRPTYSRWYSLLGVLIGFILALFVTRAFFLEPFRHPSGSMLPTILVRSNLIVQKWGYGNYGTYGLPLLHNSISSPLTRGAIIVFEYPQKRSLYYAKRVIGLPGDTVEYRDKRLVLNGKLVPASRDTISSYPYMQANKLVMAERFTETLDRQKYGIVIEPDAPPVYLAGVREFPHRKNCKYSKAGFICKVPDGQYFVMGDNRDSSSDSRYWGFVPSDHVVGKVLYILQ